MTRPANPTCRVPRTTQLRPLTAQPVFLGKIAVSGEHAEPDCVSSPETAIFDIFGCGGLAS
jgi:hypothetical protein